MSIVAPHIASAFQLSSQKVEITQGAADTETFTNTTASPMNVKVEVVPETKRELNGAKDCSSFLRVFPKVFELEPGKSQEVRILSREPGMCRMYYLVDSKENDRVDEEGNTIHIIIRVGIPVTVEPGKKEVL